MMNIWDIISSSCFSLCLKNSLSDTRNPVKESKFLSVYKAKQKLDIKKETRLGRIDST